MHILGLLLQYFSGELLTLALGYKKLSLIS